MNEPLPDQAPGNPFALLDNWLADARAAEAQPNPTSMTLATVDSIAGDVQPSARVVLCKGIDVAAGWLVFYTNYRSRKANELAHCRQAAGVFHWDHAGRQVRIEGVVVRASAAQSDAYFNSRPLSSRIGAWASEQSQPIASRAAMLAQLRATTARFGARLDEDGKTRDDPHVTVPRPPHWGGYLLWARAVEMWVQGDFRVHDRVRWERVLTMTSGSPIAGDWAWRRLQP